MAAPVSSWLAKAVVEYDRIHGSNLKAGKSGIKRLVQVTKFFTYRTPGNPEAQITGLISDKTHHVRVEFDIEATNRFESDDTDLEPQRLTANLRAILVIRAYRWKIEAPKGRMQGLEIPTLKMEILDFDIYNGGDLPVFFEDTVDVGWGKDDGQAQQVLRKWFFGESYSDMSEIEKSFERSQPDAGPSRLALSSPPKQPSPVGRSLPEGVIHLSEFLEPYLPSAGAKKAKPIPDWLFETSEQDERALADIKIFGIELEGLPTDPQPSSPTPIDVASHSQVLGSKGKEKVLPQSPSSSPLIELPSKYSVATNTSNYQTPPVPLAQYPISSRAATQQFNYTQSPMADNEDSESDGDIPIKNVKPTKRIRRTVIDPLAYPQSSGEPASFHLSPDRPNLELSEAEDMSQDADSDGLSDYERQARRQLKRKRTGSAQEDTSRRRIQPTADTITTHIPPPNAQQEEESLPATDSAESFSLTKRFPSPSKAKLPRASPGVSSGAIQMEMGSLQTIEQSVHPLVERTEESLKSNTSTNINSNSNASGNTQSLPTPPPSDHEAEAQLPSLETATNESKPNTIPKLEVVTPAQHTDKEPVKAEVKVKAEETPSKMIFENVVSPSCASGNVASAIFASAAAGPSRSRRPDELRSSNPLVISDQRTRHGGRTTQVKTENENDLGRTHSPRTSVSAIPRPASAGPSRPRNQLDQPRTSATSLAVDMGPQPGKKRFTLDLSIDGLTLDQVEQYLGKIQTARAKLSKS